MLKFLADALKKFFNQQKPQPQPLSWGHILKEAPKIEHRRKITRTMLLPSNRVLVWKSSTEIKKKKVEEGINLNFKFNYEERNYTISMKRQLDENLDETLQKIHANMLKKLKADRSLDSEQLKNSEKNLAISANFDDQKIRVSELLKTEIPRNLRINGEIYEIHRKRPGISALSLNLSPMIGCPLLPAIDFEENSEIRPIYHWFVKISENVKIGKKAKSEPLELDFIDEKLRIFSLKNYEFRGKSEFFEPDFKDLGKTVAIVVDQGSDLPASCSISTRPILEAPEGLLTDEQVFWCRNRKPGGNSIRMMTYNILADLYLNLNQEQKDLFFSYCEKEYQRSFYRIPLILRQFEEFIKADVGLFFLQEVDNSANNRYFRPIFEKFGFGLEFSKKLLQISEGVAIGFDRRRFRLISSESQGLSDLVAENAIVGKILGTSEETKERMMTRPTIVQIVILEDQATKSIILCANTHLHHNPKEEHVKLLQAYVAVNWIFRKQSEIEQQFKKSCKIVFGGDFNSTPDGPVFELFTNGRVGKENVTWKLDAKIRGEDLEISQKFECLTGTSGYTNYTDAGNGAKGFVGCLDYIWGIDATSESICPMPSHEKVIEFGAIPSKISPSDHIPSIVDVRIE